MFLGMIQHTFYLTWLRTWKVQNQWWDSNSFTTCSLHEANEKHRLSRYTLDSSLFEPLEYVMPISCTRIRAFSALHHEKTTTWLKWSEKRRTCNAMRTPLFFANHVCSPMLIKKTGCRSALHLDRFWDHLSRVMLFLWDSSSKSTNAEVWKEHHLNLADRKTVLFC